MLVSVHELIETKCSPESRPRPATVYRWIRKGQLPYRVERIGIDRWLIRRQHRRPVRRRRDRADLPPNLYQEGKRYRYRRPSDGKRFWMGTDRQRAINAALRLNAIYADSNGLILF